jgi:D-amino-acid dehydrogenase
MKTVLIIGGGVVGLCTAYYAALRGHRVTVVERESSAHEGCSYGNAGLVVPSHFIPLAAPGMVALGLKWMCNPESPFYIKPRLNLELWNWAMKFWQAANPRHVQKSAPLLRDLNLASRTCFEEFAAVPENDFGFEKKGLLLLCKSQHALDEEAKVAGHAHSLGLAAEVRDAKQTAALDPNVRMDIAGSVHFPDDCHLTPSRFMAALKQQLEKLGMTLAWETEVTGWRKSGNRIDAIQTTRGEMSADEFVLCGGSWSPLIARELGLALPMQAGKGYSLTLPSPPQLPRIPAIFTEARLAITPMGKSLRFGGTMEIAGLQEGINPARIRGIIKAVPKYYPDFSAKDFEGIQPWSGLRPCSPDGLPYVGRTGRYKNLGIATGHAMMGLSLGPISGKLMAEILSDEKPSIPVVSLNPDRYG